MTIAEREKFGLLCLVGFLHREQREGRGGGARRGGGDGLYVGVSILAVYWAHEAK